MKKLDDKNFHAWIKDMPTIVMFHADFSGPCHVALPDFELAEQRAGNRVRFCTFDLDGNPDIPSFYNVKAVPNYIVFDEGVLVSMTAGNLSVDQVLELVADV